MLTFFFLRQGGRETERRSTLPPHLSLPPSLPPTHPSSLLPRYPFHYNDNRIWRAALLLLSEPGLVISLSAPLLQTCMLVSWFILRSPRPPLKTGGSRLVQGCYVTLRYYMDCWVLLLADWPPKKKKTDVSCRGLRFNGCSAAAPGAANLFRRRLCLWPFVWAIFRSHNFQCTELPLEFCTHFLTTEKWSRIAKVRTEAKSPLKYTVW